VAKPWPSRLASSRKLKPWVHSRFRLTKALCSCVDLRCLALTLVEIKFARKVDVSFSPFGHPTQVNASWVISNRCYSSLLANEIQGMSAWNGLKMFFFPTCESVWPPNARLYASSICGTCDYLRVRLARDLKHFKHSDPSKPVELLVCREKPVCPVTHVLACVSVRGSSPRDTLGSFSNDEGDGGDYAL